MIILGRWIDYQAILKVLEILGSEERGQPWKIEISFFT